MTIRVRIRRVWRWAVRLIKKPREYQTIDGVRVDVVKGGYAAGHPDYSPHIVVRDCPWLAAWTVARSVRVAREFGLRKEGDDRED